VLLKKTNIEERLLSLKSKELLDEDIEGILANLFNEIYNKETEVLLNKNTFNFDLLETNRIYHLSHIKKICIDYRLRFLDLKYFKGKLPPKATSEIKKIEIQHNTILADFKIIAPSKLFKLENADDPLLFAPLGNNYYYYLVHKWEEDLHPFRKWLVFPFKNLLNLVVLILLISAFFTKLLPMNLFTKNSSISTYIVSFP